MENKIQWILDRQLKIERWNQVVDNLKLKKSEQKKLPLSEKELAEYLRTRLSIGDMAKNIEDRIKKQKDLYDLNDVDTDIDIDISAYLNQKTGE